MVKTRKPNKKMARKPASSKRIAVQSKARRLKIAKIIQEPRQKEEDFKVRRIKTKIVGLGGGGSSVVSEISAFLKPASFVAADTDIRTAKKIRKNVKFFQFGQAHLQGMGTGMNTDLAEKAALLEKEKIEGIFKEQNICVLVGCLGGGVASGAGPIFAEAAKNQKTLSIGIFTLPFAFEGEKKMKVAKKAISQLKEHLSGIIVVSNERIFQLTDRKMSLKKALSFLNQFFALWLVELLEVILKPSLINIDFADLRTILKDRGHYLFFSQATGAGPNRTDEVVRKLFQNNLIDSPPRNVKRVLFNIAGSKDLKLKEIETISEQIAKLNPKAKIIFGVSSNSHHQDKIKVILLAVCDEERRMKILEEKRPAIAAGKNGKRVSEKDVKEKKKPIVLPKAKNQSMKKSDEFAKEMAAVEKMRRSALEVQKADEEAEKIEWAGDTNWDIPAFLRDKFKK